jgi:hypothetical protein
MILNMKPVLKTPRPRTRFEKEGILTIMKRTLILTTSLGLLSLACADDGGNDDRASADAASWTNSTYDDSDGDSDESNSNSNSGDGDGDGDDPDSGDGDGDPDSGDGDGDGDPGDGDGDSGDGDGDSGDGDGDSGDGDGDSGDGDGDPNCGAPGDHITCDDWGGPVTAMQAIGLNCPGDPNNSTQTTAASFTAPDAATWRIATQYGTSGDWVPSEGESLLVISSGRIPAPNGAGLINSQGNQQDTSNPDNAPLPAPMSADYGSNNGNGGNPFNNCDGMNDCSDSLYDQWELGDQAANDLLWFDFSVDVPPMTSGWVVDLVYFSNEFPEYVGDVFNDMFVVWEVSESYVGNVCFIDGQPCTVTALDAIADNFSGPNEAQHPSLAGTGTQGFGSTGGQATGWVSLEGPASPDENMELTFAVFDMGDTGWDTMVVIDNWRWNCQGCVPNEVNGCGVQPQ